ncbi:hypothetical protein [Corynebacterium callunae]|nr:hypothetical protein [Corynebacterium callunae]MCK2200510.1 hypothetical protein [Corynebacterium callunae]
MTSPKHRLENSDDPLDLVVKGIFYVCVPLCGFLLAIMIIIYGIHVVIS